MDQEAFEAAVRRYWVVREGQAQKQRESGTLDAGLRGAVTGGAHMDAMAELMESIFIDAGFAPSSLGRLRRSGLTHHLEACGARGGFCGDPPLVRMGSERAASQRARRSLSS